MEISSSTASQVASESIGPKDPSRMDVEFQPILTDPFESDETKPDELETKPIENPFFSEASNPPERVEYEPESPVLVSILDSSCDKNIKILNFTFFIQDLRPVKMS